MAVPERSLRADAVAFAGRFDFDDVGAEVAQEHGAERPRVEAAEVEDFDAGQRFWNGGLV